MSGRVNNLFLPNRSGKQSQPWTQLWDLRVKVPSSESFSWLLQPGNITGRIQQRYSFNLKQAKRIQILSVMVSDRKQTLSADATLTVSKQCPRRFTLKTIYWSHSNSFCIMNNLHIQIHKHKAQNPPLGLQHIDTFAFWIYNKTNSVCGLKANSGQAAGNDVQTARMAQFLLLFEWFPVWLMLIHPRQSQTLNKTAHTFL